MSENQRDRAGGEIARVLLILVLAVGVYVNVLPAQFVWDDEVVVENNLFISNWRSLPHIFTPQYFRLFSELSYRPVATLTYFADAALWGKKPLGFHLTNILLHAVASVLFYRLAAKLMESTRAGFLAALIFAVHPVHTEAVDGVFAREDLLCAIFYFASILLFISGATCRGSGGIRRLIASVVLFLLALFSKEMAISLPVMILVLALIPPLNKYKMSASYRTCAILSYGLVFLFYLIVRFYLLQNPREVSAVMPVERLLLIPGAIATYIRLVLVPVGLCADHIITPTTWGNIIMSSALIACAVVVAVLVGRRSSTVLVASAWFFIALAPVSNLLPLRDPVAERYLYLPSAGACILLAIPAVKRRTAGIIWALFLVSVFSVLTVKRNRVWKDSLSLWSDTVAHSPKSPTAHNNLGLAYSGEGRAAEAIRELEQAVELSPRDAEFRVNLGSLYALAGSYEKAHAELRHAIRMAPGSAAAHYNLGRLLDLAGKLDEAATEYGAALRIDPYHVSARNNLAALYATAGQYGKAREEWEKVLELDPSNHQAISNLRKLSTIGGAGP